MEGKTYIVVGVHTTLEFLEQSLKTDEKNVVFAFEPNPYLVEELLQRDLPTNYHIVPMGISNFNGKSEFHIHTDSYSSSLTQWGTGPQYGEFYETRMVDVIRLDKFIKEQGIEKIDYLHIDAQGSDFNVLLSLGDSIELVREGSCESLSPTTPWKLYEGQVGFGEIWDWLISKGFDVRWEEDTNGYLKENEVTIYFKRK